MIFEIDVIIVSVAYGFCQGEIKFIAQFLTYRKYSINTDYISYCHWNKWWRNPTAYLWNASENVCWSSSRQTIGKDGLASFLIEDTEVLSELDKHLNSSYINHGSNHKRHLKNMLPQTHVSIIIWWSSDIIHCFFLPFQSLA